MQIPLLPAELFRALSSFRIRLGLALVVAALLPLVILGGTALHLAASSLTEIVHDQHLTTMNAFRGGISLFFRQRLSRLSSLSQRPEIQGLVAERIQEALPDFLSQSRFFTSLGVFDTSGQRLGIVHRGSGTLLNDGLPGTGSSPLSLTVLLREIASASSLEGRIAADFPSTTDGQPILFIQPIPDFLVPNRIVGALLAEALVQSEDLQEILAAFPAPSDTWICLLDKHGAIVARQGEGLAPEAVGFDLPSSLVLSKGSALITPRTIEVENRQRLDLVSLSYLPELGDLIAVGRPASTAFRLVITLREHLLLIAFFTFLAACGLAWLLARTLSLPVISLTEGIERVGMGVYSHRLNSDAPDELGEAARALDGLSAQLQKKMVIGSIWEHLRGRGDSRKP